MTSPDQDQISLDALFAAVGVSVPEAKEQSSRSESSTAKDTTEQDLLSALGIPHIGSLEKRVADEATVDAQMPDKRTSQEEQRDRASQWHQELLQAQSSEPSTSGVPTPVAVADAPARTASTSVASLPTLSASSIRPFGADASAGRIGVLEADAPALRPLSALDGQPASSEQAAPAGQMPITQQAPFAPQQQGAPMAGVQSVGGMQSAAAQPALSSSAQQPQAAFSQAQPMPYQQLQPLEQQQLQGAQRADGVAAAFQQSNDAARLQPLEQQAAPEPLWQAQAQQSQQQVQPQGAPVAAAVSALQQPPQEASVSQATPGSQSFPAQSAAATWQQQMAQQVSAVHAAKPEPEPVQPPQAQPPIQTAPVEKTDFSQMEAAAPSPNVVPNILAVPGVMEGVQGSLPYPGSLQAAPVADQAEAPLPDQAASSGPRPSEGPAPQQEMPPHPMQPMASVQGDVSAMPGAMAMPGMPPAQMPQPMQVPQQPLPGEALQELDQESKSSKLAHIVGGILIFIAVVCVVFAVCLLTGVIDLSAVNPNQAAQTNTANTQLSGQAAPSATSVESATNESDRSMMTSQSGSKSGEVVYSYVVRGVDGGTHEAVETATFGEDGKLVSSTLEIQTESQMDSDKLLDQMKQEFGESLVDGSATENQVICTVQLPRDDLDRDSYTELLSTNAPEFKVLSS